MFPNAYIFATRRLTPFSSPVAKIYLALAFRYINILSTNKWLFARLDSVSVNISMRGNSRDCVGRLLIPSTTCATLKGSHDTKGAPASHTHRNDSPYEGCWTDPIHAPSIVAHIGCEIHWGEIDMETNLCLICQLELSLRSRFEEIPLEYKHPAMNDKYGVREGEKDKVKRSWQRDEENTVEGSQRRSRIYRILSIFCFC